YEAAPEYSVAGSDGHYSDHLDDDEGEHCRKLERRPSA
ncbi:MAG: hypothetical protein QOH14_1181, partial [Pseudonocardiales bacterium]|nr:hypothetical protein [Pseudonocardiales bacterium]